MKLMEDTGNELRALRATTREQADQLAAKDAELAACKHIINVAYDRLTKRGAFDLPEGIAGIGAAIEQKDATIAGLRAALDYALTAHQNMANINNDEVIDEIIHDCANVLGDALAASAERKDRE